MAKSTAAPAPAPPPAAVHDEQDNLRRIELRLRGLKANSPDSPEVARMESARKDVMTRMSPQDLKAYQKAANATKTKEELEAEAEAERIAMDANKDKPPI